MDVSEKEAIKNLNDMSNLWFSTDCVDVNLKSLSNNLVNMSEETQNSQQRAKQIKQKGRKSQQFGRPMSQQRYASVNNATKRHSLSINQDASFMYDFQQQNQQHHYQQQQQQCKGLNNSINCSLSQLSGSLDHSSNAMYQVNNCMQGSKLYNKSQNTSKTSEFLSSLMTPGYNQSKKDHYEMLLKLREKERQSKETHQELVLYGNSSQQETITQSVNKLTISASTSKNEDILYQKQQNIQQEQQNTQQQQCRTSVNNIQQQQQVNNNSLYNSHSNFYPSEQQPQYQSNNKSSSNTSINCFQRVLDKIASQQQNNISQFASIQPHSSYNNCEQNLSQYGSNCGNQNNNYNHHPHTSYKANELIENSPQFLIKLKSRFSRAASCFRKKTPIKNSIHNNITVTPQGKEVIACNILNPKNIYTKIQSNNIQEQSIIQESSSNSALQLLQIVPTPLSNVNTKGNKSRKITISSQSEAGLQLLDDQMNNHYSEIDKKFDDLSEQEQQGNKKQEQQADKLNANNSSSSQSQLDIQSQDFSMKMNEDLDHKIINQMNIPLQNNTNTNTCNLNNLNSSFLTYSDENDCSPITQSHRQLDSQRQHYLSSNTRIKPNPQQYEVLKPNLYYLQSSSDNKKQNKIETLLGQMKVMGHQIKKNSFVKQQQQNKENQNQGGGLSNRQQLSLSLYGEKSFNKNENQFTNEQGQQPILSNRPLVQKCQNNINSQNNQTIFTERQYSAVKNQQRVLSAVKGRNTNQNNRSNNSSYSQIGQMNSSSAHNNFNNTQSNLKQKSGSIKCTINNENIKNGQYQQQQQNSITSGHLSKYSNTQYQPQSFRLDSKTLQTRTLAVNENQNPLVQPNNITRIFDDEALCQKVNNLLNVEMSDKSLQDHESVNQIAMNKQKLEYEQQNMSQKEIKVIVNQKGKRSAYAGRDRQKSVDLGYIATQNQQDQQKKILKKKEKNDSEMILLSAKLNQQMSKDSSISNTPRYINNYPLI